MKDAVDKFLKREYDSGRGDYVDVRRALFRDLTLDGAIACAGEVLRRNAVGGSAHGLLRAFPSYELSHARRRFRRQRLHGIAAARRS